VNVIETERLALRQLTADDAEFIFGLVNEPSWLEYIGDRGVHTIDDARGYILNGPVTSYAQNGFGLYLTVLKDGGAPIGICGLLKRDTLEDPDIGFALLPRYWSQGYAIEAATAVMSHARTALGLKRIVAITAANNTRSIALLGKLGLRFERSLPVTDEKAPVSVYA
jgi:RimJ/RimL family protein N-acetyltransferase